MKTITILIILLHLYVYSFSQTTGFSGTGANIDVVYHRCNWRVNPDSSVKWVKGSVTTYFVTKVSNVSIITFDLNKASFNNANLLVKYHGSTVTTSFPVSGAVNILSINLPSALAINVLDSVTINYGGTPPDTSGDAQGYQVATDISLKKYITTLSESFEDRDWWPCKADMHDKVDSMDIIVSVPWTGADTFWVATTGKLVDSTIQGTSRVFTFKTRYPIATYLVGLNVAKYRRYYKSVNVGGTNTQVAYYLAGGKPSETTYTTTISKMDKINSVLTAFNSKFGDYPFKNEKHGFYEGLKGAGGMEHQAFSAVSNLLINDYSTLIHELGHQWFGDKVTFATWNDLWLAEGFATYSEILAAELVPTLWIDSTAKRSGFRTTALNTSTTSVHLHDTSIVSSNAIWTTNNSNAVYKRGCMVVSMLRTLVGNAMFFQALRNYLSDPLLAYKSATTDDLKNHFEAVTGWDLDPFFNDWVRGTGNPIYTNANAIGWHYNTSSQTLYVKLNGQTRSASSTVAYFDTPIVLRLRGSVSTEDTTIVFYDQNGVLSYAGNGISGSVTGGTIPFYVRFSPTTVIFDSLKQLMAVGATAQLTVLPLKISNFSITHRQRSNDLKLSLTEGDGELQKIILQKSSDGVNFTDAGRMIKSGSAGSTMYFSYTDKEPFHSTTFYRARITTTNEETYSKILVSEYTYHSSKFISPNPATSETIIRWSKSNFSAKDHADVVLVDLAGQLIWQQSTKENFLVLNTSAIAQGSYIIFVKKDGKTVLTDKLIIAR